MQWAGQQVAFGRYANVGKGTPQPTVENDEHDRQQDEQHARNQSQRERFAKERYAKHHSRYGFERSHDGRGGRTDATDGHGHENQRYDRRDQAEQYGKEPLVCSMEHLQLAGRRTNGIGRDAAQAAQHGIKGKLDARHDNAAAVNNNNVKRVR